MKTIFRIIALIFVVPATFYFTFWVPCSHLPLWIANVLSLTCAIATGWIVWIKTKSINDGAISTMALGAILLGGIGFTCGFFGPIIFTPGANQGPLLGIFITGPAGFVLGGIAGLIYWLAKGSGSTHNKAAEPDR